MVLDDRATMQGCLGDAIKEEVGAQQVRASPRKGDELPVGRQQEQPVVSPHRREKVAPLLQQKKRKKRKKTPQQKAHEKEEEGNAT